MQTTTMNVVVNEVTMLISYICFTILEEVCIFSPNDLPLYLLCREVEDFARRLNSDWPERMQEILYLGQERKSVHFSLNDNGSVRRYASMLLSLFYYKFV